MNSDIAKLIDLARSGQQDPFLQLVQTLRREGEKDVEALLDYLEADDEMLRRAPALLARLAEDTDAGVQQACADVAERHLGALGGYPRDLPRPQTPLLAEARRRVRGFTQGVYAHLPTWLDGQLASYVDVEQLAAF